MAVHLTAEEIAQAIGSDEHVVLHAAVDVDVPVFHGKIDSVLFAEALAAANHHLAENAKVFLA